MHATTVRYILVQLHPRCSRYRQRHQHPHHQHRRRPRQHHQRHPRLCQHPSISTRRSLPFRRWQSEGLAGGLGFSSAGNVGSVYTSLIYGVKPDITAFVCTQTNRLKVDVFFCFRACIFFQFLFIRISPVASPALPRYERGGGGAEFLAGRVRIWLPS